MKTLAFYAAYAALVGVGWFALVEGRVAERIVRSSRLRALTWCALLLGGYGLSEPQGAPFQDFLDAYYAAGQAALEGRHQVVALMGRGVHGFVNPPGVAYLFIPFGALPGTISALVYLACGVAATWAALGLAQGLAALDDPQRRLLTLLFALYGPLLNSLREGNSSHFALWLLLLALGELRAGRDARAGLLVGAATVLKLPLLLLGVYFALRGRFKAVLGGALVLGSVALLSIASFGWEVHVQWYQTFVAAAGERPLGAFNVQSLSAFVVRVERGAAAVVDWDGRALSALGRATARLLALAVMGVALWTGARDRLRLGAAARDVRSSAVDLEFTLVVLVACLASPLAWTHYYSMVLLAVPFVFARSYGVGDQPWAAKLSGVGVVMIALPVVWPSKPLFASGLVGDVARLSVSHYTFGALLLFVLLVRARARSVTTTAAPVLVQGPPPAGAAV